MKVRSTIAAILFLAPALLAAQHGPGGPPVRAAPAEAKQFDFLLGQWELAVKPQATTLAGRIHGVPEMLGTWKAWRALDGWGITDELRITDASGNPRVLSYSVRMYDAATRRWNTSAADVYRNAFSSATAEWHDGRMTSSSSGTDPDGKTYLTRSRYAGITSTMFRYEQERSVDDGKTWTRTLVIEARRVAAVAPR